MLTTLPKTSSAQNTGFTLIEMLVAVSLATMLLLTISALFMTFMVSGAKSNIKRSLTREGNQALSQMEFMLRNADSLALNTASTPETCDATMDRIALISRDGWATEFLQLNDGGVLKIASVGAQTAAGLSTGNAQYLTSSNVTLTSGPSFVCTQDGPATFVTASFTLTKTSADGVATEDFKTTVQMRNYF